MDTDCSRLPFCRAIEGTHQTDVATPFWPDEWSDSGGLYLWWMHARLASIPIHEKRREKPVRLWHVDV